MLRRVLNATGLVAFWLIPGLTTVGLSFIFIGGELRPGIMPLVVGAQLAAWLVWAVLTPIIVVTTRNFPVERGRLGRSLIAHTGALLLCAVTNAAWSLLLGRVTSPAMPLSRDGVRVLFVSSLSGRIALTLLLYLAIVGATIAYDERVRRRVRELHTARLEGDLARAQLQTLQMQLQPHFLFNTLHAISMLVRADPASATRMITFLGDLLRRTLALAEVAEITLREEMEILRDYLRIEETRFGARLTVTIAVPPELLDLRVPSLILQPIVENAVRHGISPRKDPGQVSVRARRAEDFLEMEVEDDGAGFSGGESRAGGVGLATTRERLALLYNGEAMFECTAGPSNGGLVRIRIPARA